MEFNEIVERLTIGIPQYFSKTFVGKGRWVGCNNKDKYYINRYFI